MFKLCTVVVLPVTASGFAIGLRSVGLSKGQTAAKPVLGDRYFFLCGGIYEY